jgi:hypothetical protein
MKFVVRILRQRSEDSSHSVIGPEINFQRGFLSMDLHGYSHNVMSEYFQQLTQCSLIFFAF